MSDTPSKAAAGKPGDQAPPLLEVRGLTKIYDNGVAALQSVDFQVRRGEFLGIIGLSGSGKSTLLRCLNRLVEPSSGQVLFGGRDLLSLRGAELRAARKRMAMVFQHFNLIGRKSVLVNVLSGHLASTGTFSSLVGSYPPEARARARRLLEVVGLSEKERIRASQLSGGQQQRVAIARSLMQEPEMLLADEPVASLDPSTSHSVMRYLEQANREFGVTILCNLHFLSLVRQYTTRVIALQGGRIVYEGSPQDIDEAWFRRIYGEDAQEVRIQ
jgi:phosphonate transport system ATP-binding protein